MKKDLEDYMWNTIGSTDGHLPFARDVIEEMIKKGMLSSPKQAWCTLTKWSKQGIYQWGCCKDLGWKLLGTAKSQHALKNYICEIDEDG